MRHQFTYIITSYREPGQVTRLAERVRSGSPDAQIIISHDRKGPPLEHQRLTELDVHVRLTAEPISWGDRTYLESILDIFGSLDLPGDGWATILSAQDYPIKKLSAYEEHLLTCGSDVLLEPLTDSDPVLKRYATRVFRLPRFTAKRGRYGRVVSAIPGIRFELQPHGAAPVVEVGRRSLAGLGGMQVYRGSDLYCLNGIAIASVLSAPDSLLRYFSRSLVPSEAYTHTIVRNDPAIRVRNESIHYTRWGGGAHPEMLSSADLANLKTTPCWFARKFEAGDPVIDIIDSWL